MYRIDILLKSHERVQRLLNEMFHTPLLQAPAAILFGGDRWYVVEVVALLSLNGLDAGMATLAPTDEMGKGNPHIISLWIDQEGKSQTAFSYAVEMLSRLVDESITRYGKEPTFLPITPTEHTAATLAKERKIRIQIRDIGGPLTNW